MPVVNAKQPCSKLIGCNIQRYLLCGDADVRKCLSSIQELDLALLEQLKSKFPADVYDCLTYLNEYQEIPTHWKRFFKDIASPSIVTSYVQSHELLQKYITLQEESGATRISSELILEFQRESPVLLHFLSSATSDDRKISLPIFKRLHELVRSLNGILPHQLRSTTAPDHDLQYFPSLKVHCERGDYAMDKTINTVTCRKTSKTQRTFLPGIFLIHCQHGVTYGYQVMDSGESPNVPFTVLRTRFEKAPRIVIYDNACNLHRYCMLRDPGFFKNCKFFVDKMHWWNHTGCSCGYNIRLYMSWLTSINSQMTEQRNSTLRRLKASLSYMTQDNFMTHLKLFLWFRNALLSDKTDSSILKTMRVFYTKL